MPSDITIRISGDPALFKAAMAQVSTSLDQVNGKVGLSSNRMAELGSRLATIGNTLSLGVTAPVLAFGAATLKAAVEMDSLKRGLETVEGSAEKARATLIRLEEAARRPGLGFKEAISGFTSLRAAGIDANLAERSLSAFGNALATVGKGKADLDGVTLALTQIATKAVFSAQELNQLAERVPQIRLAVQAAFGTGDTEKITKLGLGNTEIIRRLVVELEKLPQASDSARNQLDNLGETIGKAAARIGEELLPHVREAVPKIEEMVKGGIDLFNAFKQLPGPIKDTAVAFGLLTIAAGPILTVSGNLMKLGGAVGGAVSASSKWLAKHALEVSAFVTSIGSKFWPAIDGFAGRLSNLVGGITSIGLVAIAAAHAVGVFMKVLIDNRQNTVDTTARSIAELNKKLRESPAAFAANTDAVVGYMRLLPQVSKEQTKLTEEVNKGSKAHEEAKDKVKKHAEEKEKLTFATALANERVSTHEGAIRAAARAWADYTTPLDQGRKKLDETRSSLDWLTDAVARYQAQLAKNIILSIPTPEGFPTLPTKPFGTTGGELAREAGGTSSADLRARANQAGDDYERVLAAQRRGAATAQEVAVVYEKWVKAEQAAAGSVEATAKRQSKSIQQVSTILTDLSRGIANAGIGLIFNRATADVSKYTEEIKDLKIEQNKLIASQAKGNNVTVQLTRVQEKLADANRRMGEELRKASLGFRALEAGKSIVADLAKSITRVLIEGALEDLSKKLLKVGGIFGKVFGGGTGVIKSITDGGGSDLGAVAKNAGGGASSGASSAIGGIGGWIGIGAQVASAVSGVIGNFQMAHMNTALGRIEESTRFSQIHLLHTLEKANEYWPYMKGVWESLVRMESRNVSIAGAGGETYNFNFAGAQFGAGFNQAQAEAIFTTVVTKFKQKGLSK